MPVAVVAAVEALAAVADSASAQPQAAELAAVAAVAADGQPTAMVAVAALVAARPLAEAATGPKALKSPAALVLQFCNSLLHLLVAVDIDAYCSNTCHFAGSNAFSTLAQNRVWQKQPRDKSISDPGATDPNIGLEFARRHLKVVAARIWRKLQEALLNH